MASQVFYLASDGQESDQSAAQGAARLLAQTGLVDVFVPDAFCAVKTHFGEAGNTSYVPPACVKAVA